MDRVSLAFGRAPKSVDSPLRRAVLEGYVDFLDEHVDTHEGASHCWQGEKSFLTDSPYLKFEGEADVTMLHSIVGGFAEWGVPLPLCEMLPAGKQVLHLDLEVKGEKSLDILKSSPLTEGIAHAVFNLFNNQKDPIDCALYTCEGPYSSQGRLIFPSLVVSQATASRVRATAIQWLSSAIAEGGDNFDHRMLRMKKSLSDQSEDNTWACVLKAGQENPRIVFGADAELGPALKPQGAIQRYSITQSGLFCQTPLTAQLSSEQWVKFGSLRAGDRAASPFDADLLASDLPRRRTGPGGSPARSSAASPVIVPGRTVEQAWEMLGRMWRMDGDKLTNGRTGSSQATVADIEGGVVVAGDPAVVSAVRAVLLINP